MCYFVIMMYVTRANIGLTTSKDGTKDQKICVTSPKIIKMYVSFV